MIPAQAPFYVIGGTLTSDAPCYVQRQADSDLYEGLKKGEFCYVLTSRQMGKSSLMVRTAERLRHDGTWVAILDLTAVGRNLTAEQWYDGLLGQIASQFKLEDELEVFWLANTRLGPLQRWMRAIREVVLPLRAGRVVIFVDEIDAVRGLPFSTDEFFAAIRELYNRRAQDAELGRLAFCLLGVATPSDLIQDTRTTPFNVGRRVELGDFTDAEAAPLAKGLHREDVPAAELLKRILYWTGGHPYLTQRLCSVVADDPDATKPVDVDRVCEELFLSNRARERDDNLLFVRERLLRSEVDRAGVLDLYGSMCRKPVLDDETNPLIGVLRLSGVARVVNERVQIRNRIYERVFDRRWIEANMPDSDKRRQRRAYRRGVLRASGVLGAILAVAIVASFSIWKLCEEQGRLLENELCRSNEFAAAHAANTIQLHLERIGDAVSAIAESPELQRYWREYEQHGHRQADRDALQSFFEKMQKAYNTDPNWGFKLQSTSAGPFASLTLIDERGRFRAYSPFNNVVGDNIYDGRDYFRGAKQLANKPRGRRDYVSRVFRSEIDERYRLAVSVPFCPDGRFAGVVSATVITNATFGLDHLHDQEHKVALLAVKDPNRPRGPPLDPEPPPAYVVLLHPCYTAGDLPLQFPKEQLPRFDTLDADGVAPHAVNSFYQDPAGERDPAYAGRWLAGFAKVGNSQMIVIVQQRDDIAVAPYQGFLWQLPLWVLGLVAVGVILAWLLYRAGPRSILGSIRGS